MRVVIPKVVDDHREESLRIVIEIANLVGCTSKLSRDVVVVSNFHVASETPFDIYDSTSRF